MQRFPLVSLLCAVSIALAGEPAPDAPVRLAKFKDNRAAAISFTLDDGWEDNATKAAPLLDKYGIRATFFLVPGRIPDADDPKAADDYGRISWKTWKKIADAGHEIANHSLHHPALVKADDATLETEVNRAHEMLKEKIGTAPVSFAYPYNGRNERIRAVVLARHCVAREFETGYGGPNFTTEKANALLDDAIAKQRWMVPMVHAIEKGYAAFTSASVFEEHLKYVQSQKDKVWIDTFGNVARYVKARDAAKLEATAADASVSFTLTSALDAERFGVPLTVLVRASGAASAEAKREGAADPLPVMLSPDGVLLHVVPGPGRITVTWKK